jgi:hypothetical protein
MDAAVYDDFLKYIDSGPLAGASVRIFDRVTSIEIRDS